MELHRKDESCIEDDPELCALEKEIQKGLNLIEKELDCNGIVFLIYNPMVNPLKGGGEIYPGDSKNIKAFLDGLKTNQATVLLHGPGGNFDEGILIALIMREKFISYRTFVPQLCCSALCFPVLKSDKLIMLKGASLTQIDPIFTHRGKSYRAIQEIFKEGNNEVKRMAKKVWDYAEKKIFELIKEPPSLFNHEKIDFEYVDQQNIIDEFMNKAEHHDEVKDIAFISIPFKKTVVSNESLKILSSKLIDKVQTYLMQTGRRYCIGSTYETTIMKKGEECKGHILYVP